MAPGPEFEINVDLFRALRHVMGAPPTKPEPVVVVAVYVHSLAKGYGLSERVDEDPLERAAVPEPARAQLASYLPELRSRNADALRDRLYDVFVEISRDARALKLLNGNDGLKDVEFLKVAQIFWNLEASEEMPLLPIRPSQRVGIGIPNVNGDFATMRLTARTMKKGAVQSSGQALRILGARVAVLVARRVVADTPQALPSLEGAALMLDGKATKASIVWPDTKRDAVVPSVDAKQVKSTMEPSASTVPEEPVSSRPLWSPAAQVLVGGHAGIGEDYQRRGFDDEVDRLWAVGGDRRVWLRGGPGLGKSYTARRVMQEAVAGQGEDREDLLIWVDSADPQSVRGAYASAVERMPQLGISVDRHVPDRVDRQARALLEVLACSTWRWLIVLDNAEAGALIEEGLIPSGVNPNGRVLVTTLSRDHRIAANGRAVAAEKFTQLEAEGYLRAQRDPTNGQSAVLARASSVDITALATAVGHHPLALSIAVATIVVNAMEIRDWIAEFRSAEMMDVAADARDGGGYPHLLGATWKLALSKASRGMPDGVVERAAMVASLQDPDGHPAWLWDRDDVTGWVAEGAAFARHHGIPVAVHRLIDHGIVELVGDSWKNSRVVIHKLAARAVREVADPATLADLATVLVSEWLIHLPANEAATRPALRRSIEPLASLPGLSMEADLTITALLGYARQCDTSEYRWEREAREAAAAYLVRGGTTGRALTAHQLATLGDEAVGLRLPDEARARHAEAAQIYEQLSSETTFADDERATHLHALGKLHQKLGHLDRARGAFVQAQQLYEQLLDADEASEVLEYLMPLRELHEVLGNRIEMEAVAERALRAFDATADLDLVEIRPTSQLAQDWEEIAEVARSLGRPDRALSLLTRAAEVYQLLGVTKAALSSLRKAARVHAEYGRWEEAEALLDGVTTGEGCEPDDLVLLASVQMRLGRIDAVAMSITRAATIYRERDSDTSKTHLDRPPPDAVVELSLMSGAQDAQWRGRWGDAADLHEGLVEFYEERAERNPGEHERKLADANLALAVAKGKDGRPGEALGPLTRAVRISQMLTDLDPDEPTAQNGLLNALAMLAAVYGTLSRLEEAAGPFERAFDMVSGMSDPDPEDQQARDSLALHLHSLGVVAAKLGETERAAYCYTRLVDIRLAAVRLSPKSATALRDLARAEHGLGSAHRLRGDLGSAEEWLACAIDSRQELVDLDPEDREAQEGLAAALTELGLVQAQLERIDEAAHAFTRAVEILRGLAGLTPDGADVQARLALALQVLGRFHRAMGRLEESAECQTRASNVFLLLVEMASDGPADYVVHGAISTLNDLAGALTAQGRLNEADIATARAEEVVRRFPAPGND